MKIVIDDHKNIKNLTITIPSSRLLILLGSNGVGKTNTLEAIYLNKFRLLDEEVHYDQSYLLALDSLINHQDYYPHQQEIYHLFGENFKDISSSLFSYLEKMYQELNKPLLRKFINDALASLSYSVVNQRFDPSTLAITRLVILNRLLQKAKENNEKYIILVDSPELFAHPILMDEITTILQQLKHWGCIVIVSTHSDHIISRLFKSFAELVRLDKSKHGLVTIQSVDIAKVIEDIRAFYDADEMLKHSFSRSGVYDEGLLTLLNRDIEAYLIIAFRDFIITAFFSRIVVLGEGASENVLFDFIENELHPNWLSEHQVGFISCMGKSTMPLYFIFLNNLGVKAFVLYDLDSQDNIVHQAYRKAFENYFEEHRQVFRSYYLKPDLEGFLNIDSAKLQSIIKPLHIFNHSFLQEKGNGVFNRLLDIMEENILKMAEKDEY